MSALPYATGLGLMALSAGEASGELLLLSLISPEFLFNGEVSLYGALDGLFRAPQRKFETLRIIHGREQACSPSAALSLYPEAPRVLFRISS
jgi:hypothetical protein